MTDPDRDLSGISDHGDAGQSAGQSQIGWFRAVATGAAIVALGFVGAVEVPNLIVVRLRGLTDLTRSLLASSVAVIAVVVTAWLLRVFQRRGLL